MSDLSFLNFLRERKGCCNPVNLFSACGSNTGPDSPPTDDGEPNEGGIRGRAHRNKNKQINSLNNKPRFSVIVDSEFCLDRLYGGCYSDWVCGGQWNRMLSYVTNLSRACRSNNIQLTIAFRGGVEKEHQDKIMKANREFKERLGWVAYHLQNRGTPPPKVWWLPPTALRDALCLAFGFNGMPIFVSSGDYYTDVLSYVHEHNLDGILTDDPAFALFKPPRIFAAHDFKLTYKGSLETKEYSLTDFLSTNETLADRLPLFASLLGNHLVPADSLKNFHANLMTKSEKNGEDSKSSEEPESVTVEKVVDFVEKVKNPEDLEAVAQYVFESSDVEVGTGLEMLKSSIEYYKTFQTSHRSTTPTVIKSEHKVQPIKSDGKQRKKNAVVNTDCGADEVAPGVEKPTKSVDTPSSQINGESPLHVNGANELVSETSTLSLGDSPLTSTDESPEASTNGTEKIADKLPITVAPSEAILKLAIERHSQGLMSPVIVQSLIEREVRLPCYIEEAFENSPCLVEIYRPIRQSVYAILHNLNKHLYDTRKIAEEHGNTISADDITIEMAEHYLNPQGSVVKHDMKVKPVPWPVPSIESLWLGVKPENKQRRMKAFLSCMNVGNNPLMSPDMDASIPEAYLLICCVLRYLLKTDPLALSLLEVDAVLSTFTSHLIFDVQTMQDLQLMVITTRGAHVASLLMAGVQHAMLVNDTCGAPIRKQCTFPWLYFDGKLLQYKLLRSAAANIQHLDLCDGNYQQVLMMEKCRAAVLYGLDGKLGEQSSRSSYSFASALPPGRLLAGPAAFLRPNLSGGRGKGSLMGEFMPLNSRLDGRGGKLQVAGQVVATWGPRPGSRDNHRHAGVNGQHSGPHTPPHAANNQRHHRRKQNNKSGQSDNKNRSQKQNHSEERNDKQNSSAKSVTIVTKDEADDDEAKVTDSPKNLDTEPQVNGIGEVVGVDDSSMAATTSEC